MARTEKQMQRYYERKEAGICVHCGKQKNDGSTMCAECHKKMTEYNRKYKFIMTDEQYAKYKKHSIKWQKNHSEWCKEYSRRYREEHREYYIEHQREYYKKHRFEILEKRRIEYAKRKEQKNGEAE